MSEERPTEDASVAKHSKYRSRIEELAKELGFDPNLGKKCPKCGASMIHTRLHGYVCHSCR